MKIDSKPASLPINLVMDGSKMIDNINIAKIEESFIEDCIEKANIKSLKDVLILTLDNNGEVYIQDKYGKHCLSFDTNYNGEGKW